MSKKIIALSTMLLSVLLVLITVETVTGRGLLEGQCTFYQTISPFGKYFNLSQSDKLPMQWLGIIMFIIGTLLLFVPNFVLFEHSKKRSIILVIINIMGIILGFLFFQLYSYMFMLIILCILLVCNIFIQFFDGIRSRSDMSVLILTALIGVLNIYYLFHHFMMYKQLDTWYFNGAFDRMTREMIHISRINMICLALWIIPYVILLVKEIKGNGNKSVKS